MSLCPLCNGMNDLNIQCQSCNNQMSDKGRYFDYFGDYSPYESIELMKESDGIATDKQDETCPHLFTCESCQQDKVILVQEV
ncbi:MULTISPECIES: hypothetical protein [Bacillaceae]|uniref:Uncharacterized protein n=1 Tax=Evansella alkalicola TaxID=745819 RepID=A0ABS6JSR9_9BACI|nr:MULTISPECIES: hypothetical protein [Bacillaceae]MBU9720749.1 hypothetical protein [Bacillus alkalicola]